MDDISHESVKSTDENLMQAYQAGDLASFEQLYQRHKASVFRYILRQGISHAIAEEILQDIWSGIIKGRRSYQPTARFTTWLYQISRNKLIDYYRRHQNHLQLLDSEEIESVADESTKDTSKETQLKQVLNAVHELPFPQRQVFLLHYEAGLSARQVSEITKEHPEAVKSSLRYAVRKLKQRIGINEQE